MSKHPLSGHEPEKLPADDLRDNPGIGQSKGMTAAGANADDFDDLEGDNTVEGDVDNDVGPGGRVDPGIHGRTNP